jgi:hypothetical protein
VASAGAVTVGDACLRLCVSPATSALAADDKTRFLALMVGWAWPRDPALGAVLDAARQAESAAWGEEIARLLRPPQARTT